MSERAKRLVRVGASGIAATSVDVLLLIVLVELGGVYVTVAAFLAASAGGFANFTINKFWAFKDPAPIDFRQVSSYAFVSVMTACFVALTVHVFAVLMGVPYLLAKALAAVVVFLLWSYPAQSRLVFPESPAVKSV